LAVAALILGKAVLLADKQNVGQERWRPWDFNPLDRPVTHLEGPLALLLILVLFASSGPVSGQQASVSTAKPNPASTPIPLAKIPLEAQSALAALQEIDVRISRDLSSADDIVRTLSELTSEIDARIAGDTSLLATSPSLDVLYRLKLTWQKFCNNLSISARELTLRATSLEEQLARLVH
jgi:hypothetical protein